MCGEYHVSSFPGGPAFWREFYLYLCREGLYKQGEFIVEDNFGVHTNKEDKEKKFVLFVRHPCEIIYLSYRHHSVTDEYWWAKKVFDPDPEVLEDFYDLTRTKELLAVDGSSYQDILNSIKKEEDRIVFEMLHSSRHTCTAFHNDFLKYGGDDNYFFLRVEDLLNEETLYTACERVCDIFSLTDAHERNVAYRFFQRYFEAKRISGEIALDYKFPSVFRKKHYDVIEERYPENFLEDVQYL